MGSRSKSTFLARKSWMAGTAATPFWTSTWSVCFHCTARAALIGPALTSRSERLATNFGGSPTGALRAGAGVADRSAEELAGGGVLDVLGGGSGDRCATQ